MRKNYIIKGLGTLLVAGAMTSCSDDYLDLNPVTEVDNSAVVSNETAIRTALYGIFQLQYKQYSNLYDWYWFNGEPWVSMVYGDLLSQDYVSNFFMARVPTLTDWSLMVNPAAYATLDAWVYCYNIISQCNNIIAVDNENVSGEVAFRMAQAYTMRAHAYFRLMQIYGPRKADSNGGSADAVVIRTPENAVDESVPLSSYQEVMSLIYSDLDKALALYAKSGQKRSNIWETDAQITQGIYSRVALLNEDWQTAYNMATAARAGYDVMSMSEYATTGFESDDNTEWMWGTAMTSMNLYYASYGATYACNGAYVILWGSYGCGSVNMDLYRQVYDPNDIRCARFFTPDKVDESMQDNFWNPAYVSPTNMNVAQSGFRNEFTQFIIDQEDMIYDPSWNTYDAYYNGGNVVAGFGTQFKFWGTDVYSASSFPFMRTSEMILNAAEAACHLNNSAAAQQLVDEIQKNRIAGYTSTNLSGNDLLDYVKLVRRWELWGEGFNWFDFKRWNEPVVRNAWMEGDPTSNNIPSSQAKTFPTNYNNGWKWSIPNRELNFNGAL